MSACNSKLVDAIFSDVMDVGWKWGTCGCTNVTEILQRKLFLINGVVMHFPSSSNHVSRVVGVSLAVSVG